MPPTIVEKIDELTLCDGAQRLARYLGLPGSGIDAAMKWVLDLRREIGIPHTLKEIGEDILDMPYTTVKRRWSMAKAFLHGELVGDEETNS